MGEFVRVASVKDVPPGTIKGVRLGGREIAVAHVGGRYYAFDAYCPHSGWPLTWGALYGERLVCGLHAWQFDLRTGDALVPAVPGCLLTFPVRVDGEALLVADGPIEPPTH